MHGVVLRSLGGSADETAQVRRKVRSGPSVCFADGFAGLHEKRLSPVRKGIV
jgi:hypothetical protein